jgi:hypothetical protein
VVYYTPYFWILCQEKLSEETLYDLDGNCGSVMPYLGVGAEIHQLKLDIDWHLAKTKAFPSFAQFLVCGLTIVSNLGSQLLSPNELSRAGKY